MMDPGKMSKFSILEAFIFAVGAIVSVSLELLAAAIAACVAAILYSWFDTYGEQKV